MGRLGMVSSDKIVVIKTIVLLCFCLEVAKGYPGGPDTTLVSTACSDEKIQENSPYCTALSVLLLDLTSTAIKGFDYYASTQFHGAIIFGHGACNGALSMLACNDCLNVAEDALAPCGDSIGAQAQLKDCRIRYEKYPFID